MGARHDRYWEGRDWKRAAERSRARAWLALDLLRRDPPRSGSARPRLLDAGCGPGWALEVFTDGGFEASGLDASPLAVREARRRGLEARVASLEHDPLGGPYEVIAALEVLEHLADPLGVLERLAGTLAPAGRLVVSLPNEFHLLRRLAVLAGHTPFGGHDDPHLRHFDERLARRLFTAARLRVLARVADGLVPPRWPFLRDLARPAVTLLPGLLALAHVFLLEPAGAESAPRRRGGEAAP